MKNQQFSRRRFIGAGMLAAAGMAFASKSSFANSFLAKPKPNSKFNGVQIGVITYSYRSLPGSIQQILQYCIDSNINAIELMGDAAEAYAGAPPRDGSENYAAQLATWRENTIMDSFFAIRKMFNDAGINIYAWKPNALGAKNTDGEIDYAFNAGKALGCSHVTVELPDAVQTQRLGDIAEKHGMIVAYHAHTQATPTLWDVALSQSDHNGINLDIGHYVAGTSSSPVDFILKNHKRIASMHIKDRKFHDGPNMPWGEGDTPIKEVLALIKKNDYKFPATIELEYKIPEGSDPVKEVIKCREYAKNALA
ncbi:sugar phosphate isomerase/epimerase [Mucilaginibacter frigoritolerans]|uniref:Sugar phosphate isomerase/epimerase n=1 Tax=Mucilaginibacter frigoritolerans TaxID=652788 RepID=A0A562UCT6_9SPHI|nr:TIM barrel protein [Mucilaginibacter frigoritolerans]TWJ03409.1 sugar phosphate isomerase/epimerase [Mucilaginibacter frigoritolerans]